jgi:hypothetical protein
MDGVSVCKKRERAERVRIIGILPSFPADRNGGFLSSSSVAGHGVALGALEG